ncbi:hypothetical protein [Kitasatospora sp. NPDC059160]|uniref:hypothetical protein n=1 Tax=Kitasatospora sp. NPDC059160 TaxID=3346748 RepID=UPI0036857688
MAATPAGAVKLIKAAEAANWKATGSSSWSEDGSTQYYCLHATNGAGGELNANWYSTGRAWRLSKAKPCVMIDGEITAATLPRLAEIIAENPGEPVAEIAAPPGAVKISKAAEAAGWDTDAKPAGNDAVSFYELSGTNRVGEKFRASWCRQADRWRIDGNPVVRVAGSEWIGARIAEIVALVEANPAPSPLPIAPAYIGRCDAIEQAHGKEMADFIGVRLYYVFNGKMSEKCGQCANCSAVRAHRPVTDFPVWELTAEDRQCIEEQTAEYIEEVRQYAAYEWASAVYWDDETPHQVPSAFDDWYGKSDHIDPAAAYALWREEQGRPLTDVERFAVGLTGAEPEAVPVTWECAECGTHNAHGEPQCTVCASAPAEEAGADTHPYDEDAEAKPLPAFLVSAHIARLYALKRTAPSEWHLTFKGELYRISRTGHAAYQAEHLASGAVPVPFAEPGASLYAAAQLAKAHARQRQAS